MKIDLRLKSEIDLFSDFFKTHIKRNIQMEHVVWATLYILYNIDYIDFMLKQLVLLSLCCILGIIFRIIFAD